MVESLREAISEETEFQGPLRDWFMVSEKDSLIFRIALSAFKSSQNITN